MIIQLNDESDIEKLDNGILYFTADWCNKCKIEYEELCSLLEEKKYTCIKIDIDDYSDLSVEYEIEKLPTYIQIKNNQVFKKHTSIKNLNNEIKNT